MDILALVVLIVGIGAVAAASTAVIRSRRLRADDEQAPVNRPGLIEPEPVTASPAGLTPGMVNTLLRESTTSRDVLITLIDLAQRGFLSITVLAHPDRPAHDWVLTRTTKRTDGEGLHGFEHFLLNQVFAGPDDSVTLSSVVTSTGQVLSRTKRQLRDDTMGRGWFQHGSTVDSRWGRVGGVVIVIGLVLAVLGVIQVMATGHWGVLAGPVLIVVAGLELASLGRLMSKRTDEGASTRDELLAYRRHLDSLSAEQIPIEDASGILHDSLSYALAFDTAEQLGQVIEQVVDRAERWGARIDLGLDWFRSPEGDRPVSAFVVTVAGFVDAGARLADERGGEF
ncbi:DUF2207 family protein [Propionibacterium australiense]|uniref:Predicted membrane protein (DUF2207) n=1 Tax=Propionibacterium australiense TaxID=119981 RepID=A0A383S639_9ACTN|nr:DUF2207 domain-containing protein [Propionibacterium australiense]SYZ33448.1 Predicted membrane protein (DUF2207) [Propionibacterium australiense]VEH91825.1 Predicted membrane protein (DUF2207) [Propionibacterium australiense]